MPHILRTLAPAFLACACAALSGFDLSRADVRSADVQLRRLPDGALQPRVVVDDAGTVHLIFFKGEPGHGDVFYSRIERDGTLVPAVQVNRQSGSAIATGNVRGPQLAIGRRGNVHVAWAGSDRARRDSETMPMLYTRMRVDGRFEPERNVHQQTGPIDGGSIAADRTGDVYIVWHSEMPGARGETNRRAWVARSTDDGTTFAPETAASPDSFGACGCCGTGGFVDRNGSLYVLFRAAREAEHRDAVLLVSTDRGRTFASRSLQPWDVKACPMSTFSVAEGAGVVAAWETAGQVYWTRVDSGDVKPIAAPGATGARKHPSVARNSRGETLLAWTEGMSWSRGGTLAWQAYDASGLPIGQPGRAEGVPAWSLVAAYAQADGGFSIIY